MGRKMNWSEMAAGGWKFFRYMTWGGLFNINLEVTKRCNARCAFCDYWQEEPPAELADYVPVVRKLNPLSVSLTGGEPLLRKDLAGVIGSLRRSFRFLHISLITNGALLTPRRGAELWDAGLDEFSISLDYLDERHDRDRGIPGLSRHILGLIPELKRHGIDLCFNVVLKRGNYREIPDIVRAAADMGVKVSLSTYNHWRNKNDSYTLPEGELAALEETLNTLRELKGSLGNLTTGEYYMGRIVEFFRQGGVPGCTAGLNWIQVTPDGGLKRCSDHPLEGDFTMWRRGMFKPSGCDRCWYSCRGAAQEPWTVNRFMEMARDALS